MPIIRGLWKPESNYEYFSKVFLKSAFTGLHKNHSHPVPAGRHYCLGIHYEKAEEC